MNRSPQFIRLLTAALFVAAAAVGLQACDESSNVINASAGENLILSSGNTVISNVGTDPNTTSDESAEIYSRGLILHRDFSRQRVFPDPNNPDQTTPEITVRGDWMLMHYDDGSEDGVNFGTVSINNRSFEPKRDSVFNLNRSDDISWVYFGFGNQAFRDGEPVFPGPGNEIFPLFLDNPVSISNTGSPDVTDGSLTVTLPEIASITNLDPNSAISRNQDLEVIFDREIDAENSEIIVFQSPYTQDDPPPFLRIQLVNDSDRFVIPASELRKFSVGQTTITVTNPDGSGEEIEITVPYQHGIVLLTREVQVGELNTTRLDNNEALVVPVYERRQSRLDIRLEAD